MMEINCTRRIRSTVSTQALTLLNSESTVGYARAFADRVLRDGARDPVRLAVLVAFAREPSTDEHAALRRFEAAQRTRYESLGDSPDKGRHRALADVCHMLLAANEFVYVD